MTCFYLFVRAVGGSLDGIVRPGHPGGQAKQEAGDLVCLLDVQLVLVALVGGGGLHHPDGDSPPKLFVGLCLGLQAGLRAPQPAQDLVEAGQGSAFDLVQAALVAAVVVIVGRSVKTQIKLFDALLYG